MLFLGSHTTGSLAQHVKGIACILFVQERCSSAIKIEGTRRPSERLLAIDADNSTDTFLVGMVRVADDADLKTIEEQLFVTFATSRIRGRWFRATQDLIEYINAHGTAPIRELLGNLQSHSHPSDTITIEEIAAELRVSVKTVRRMVKAGNVPYLRAGKQLRFIAADVLASIQSEP